MEILVITWNFPPRRGGIENLLSDLCAALRQNHSVVVVTSHAPAPQPIEEGVFRAPWRGLVPFVLYALWRGAWVLFRRPGTKIVFGGSAMVTPVVLALARLFGRKSIVQAHGLDVVYPKVWYRLLCVRWLKGCGRVIANSAYTASLTRRQGVSRDRVAVIHPGVDPGRFVATAPIEQIKRELGFPAKHIILFVGRLADRKGVKEFIRLSLTEIVRQVPDVCFVIVGDDARDSLTHRTHARRAIEAVTTEMNLQSHVRFLGALSDEDLIKCYHACDLLVLPALDVPGDPEGFGIVMLEAAAAGKPVVATRVGGIPDAVEDKETGLLIDPGNHEQLSHEIVDLLHDEQRMRFLSVNAKRRALEQFAWDIVVARYQTVFQSLANDAVAESIRPTVDG
jgi:phosphatidylinositol alpha-1,6-mannosyltransferase